MEQQAETNWIPYRLVYNGNGQWQVKWLYLGELRMTDPFFDETISRCRCRQQETGIRERTGTPEEMVAAARQIPALEPAAFIFHVSRCGSTLLSQAFSPPEENIVIAEAPLLDEILRAAEQQPGITEDTINAWFRAALLLMGQRRNFREHTFIIKLDSWHIHFYTRLRAWFPQLPFFFLYRRPDQVLASHEKQRGIHAVPGMVNPILLGTEEPAVFGGDFNRYTAQVLLQYYRRMQDIFRQQHSQNHFFDFAGGAPAMIQAFSHFTGIPVQDAAGVEERLQYHSKSAQQVFKPEPTLTDDRFFFSDCHDAYTQLQLLTL